MCDVLEDKPLHDKLRELREERMKQEVEKGRKNWDNIDPCILKRIEDLEGHRQYIESEKQEVIHNKKDILFKQRYHLLSQTDEMCSKVEGIIENEKDKLLDVFDDQLNHSRKSLTPSSSFYTNSRLNRSSSFDVHSYNHLSSNTPTNNIQIS